MTYDSTLAKTKPALISYFFRKQSRAKRCDHAYVRTLQQFELASLRKAESWVSTSPDTARLSKNRAQDDLWSFKKEECVRCIEVDIRYCHRQGCIDIEVKADNIMISMTNRPIIIDLDCCGYLIGTTSKGPEKKIIITNIL